VAWLVCRERWQSLGLWVIALLAAGSFVALLINTLPSEGWIVWNYIGGLLTLILYLWAASQACRFLVEARRSGLLELLLATPLSERQIVAGQWQALLRMFGLPVLLLLSAHVAGSTLSQVGLQRITTRASTIASSVITNQSGIVSSRTIVVGPTVTGSVNAGTNAVPASVGFQPVSPAWQTVMAVAAAVAAALSTAANLLALCWFGMWMGLTSRTANLATLKTILFVQVIPWFVITFGLGIMMALLMSGMLFRGMSSAGVPSFASMLWWPLLSAVLVAVMAVAKDIGFIVWSRKKLHSCLREEAARSLGQPRFVVPRPLPATVAAPPIIAAPQ
jgi:hypothetical protein